MSDFQGVSVYDSELYLSDGAGLPANSTDTVAITIATFGTAANVIARPGDLRTLPHVNPATGESQGTGPRGLAIWPLSADGANDDFSFALRLWMTVAQKTANSNRPVEYVPVALWEGDAVCGANAMVAAGFTGLSYCDQIVEVTAIPAAFQSLVGSSAIVYSPLLDQAAALMIQDISHVISAYDILFDLDGATSGALRSTVGMNALVQPIF